MIDARRCGHSVEPLALACPTHDQHVALARSEDHVVGARTRGDALDRHAALEPRSKDERPARAEHSDRDDGVVEPSHLTITVQPLEVVTVAIEDRRDAGERHLEARPQMEVGLAQHGIGVVAHADTEPVLGDVLVVAEDFGLRPRERLVQLSEDALGIADEARHELDPRGRRQRDALDRRVPIDLQLVRRQRHCSSLACSARRPSTSEPIRTTKELSHSHSSTTTIDASAP